MCGGMAMIFNGRNRIPVSDGALIAAGGVLAAWYSPQPDPLSIVCVVLLARFRGRAQSVIGAFTFCLPALVSAIVKPIAHSRADLIQLFSVICVMWVCAIFVSGARVDATAHRESEEGVL